MRFIHVPRRFRRQVTNTFLFARDRYRCQYCGRLQIELKPRESLTRDHLIPLSRGGTNDWSNVVTACSPCNTRKANRLPNVKGLKGPLGCLTQARYGITWGPIGAAIACFTEATEYAKQRVLFKKPIAANQAVQLKLADMARRITLAQLLSLQLGRLKDAGNMQPTQVSLAKWNNCRMAIDIAREARDILGAAGITTEHCPIRHGLNLESVITYEGTETVHQLVVGREVTGINAF